MTAPRGDSMLCPNCRYDISSMPGNHGQCPECGRAYSIPALKRTNLAIHRLALGMVGLGALASLPLELNAVVMAAYSQSEDATPPFGPWFPIGSIVPVLGASGVAILGWMTTGRRWRRYGIIGIAGAFVFCVLFVLSAYFHSYQARYVVGSVAPHGLLPVVLEITPLLGGLTLIAAAGTLSRVARPFLGIGLIRSLKLALALACASVLAAATNWAHGLSVPRDTTLTEAWKLWGTIDAGSALMADWLSRLSCLLVGMGALVALVVLRTESHLAPPTVTGDQQIEPR